MLNDTSYTRAHKEASSPPDTSPTGNICIEPERTGGRTRPYLKAWGTYSFPLTTIGRNLTGPKSKDPPVSCTTSEGVTYK